VIGITDLPQPMSVQTMPSTRFSEVMLATAFSQQSGSSSIVTLITQCVCSRHFFKGSSYVLLAIGGLSMTTAVAPATSFNEVLIATDFGQEADRALAYAKSIVRASDGELLLVHVAEPVPHFVIPEGAWVDDPLRAKREIESTEATGNALRADGFRAVAMCPFGSVTEEIADAARNHHANLVVVGTHGRYGLNRLMRGSHAEHIADALQIPVLIVGPKAPWPPLAQWEPKNILCATSLDKNGAQLVAFAYKIAREHKAHLEIAYRDVAEEQKDYCDWLEFKKAVRDLLPFEGGIKPRFHALFLEEPESESLVQTATARQVDLLVLGMRHKFIEWPALRAGGILPRLLAEAPCPLLAVPIQGS
jgi:nucleotide-binding universal stress UspA family protein